MTKKCKKIFIYLFLFYFGLVGVHGQQLEEYVEVGGVIKSSQSLNPLPTTIKFKNAPHHDHQGIVKSNDKGEYRLFLKKEENYSIEFISEGYLNYRKSSVYYDSLKNQHIFLHPKEEGTNILSSEIYFEKGKHSIISDSEPSLDSLFTILSINPDIKVQIEGHTDFKGNDELNFKLSEDRTKQVKSYLVNKGIHPRRIKVKAFGETQPIILEGTDEARQENRRVEVKILKF